MRARHSFTRFSSEATRARLLLALTSGQPVALSTRALAAWHLRQTQSALAFETAQSLLADARLGRLPWQAQQLVRGCLWLVMGEWHWLHGRALAAAKFTHQAAQVLEAAGCWAGLSDTRWLESSLAHDQANLARRDALMQQSADAAKRANDAERWQAAQLALACFAVFSQGADGFAQHRALVEPARTHANAGLRSLAECFFSHGALADGALAQGLVHARAGQQAALQAGQWRRAIIDGANVGSILSDLGDQEASLAELQQVLALARESRWLPVTGSALMALAQLLQLMGRLDEASALADEAVLSLATWSDSRAHMLAVHTAADCAFRRGQWDQAQAMYQQLLIASRDTEADEIRRYSLLGLGRVEAQRGQGLAAWAFAQQALAQARGAHDLHLQVDVLRLLAHLQAEGHGDAPATPQARADAAVTLLREAVALQQQFVLRPDAVTTLQQELAAALHSVDQLAR
jgi:tetratricopeptide (TPR) repeat protein